MPLGLRFLPHRVSPLERVLVCQGAGACEMVCECLRLREGADCNSVRVC